MFQQHPRFPFSARSSVTGSISVGSARVFSEACWVQVDIVARHGRIFHPKFDHSRPVAPRVRSMCGDTRGDLIAPSI